MNEEWCFSFSGEYWFDVNIRDSREAAISAAAGENRENDTRCYVGRVRRHTIDEMLSFGMVNAMLESMNDAAAEDAGECADTWPMPEGPGRNDAIADLRLVIQGALVLWARKHDVKPKWFSVTDIEKIELEGTQ